MASQGPGTPGKVLGIFKEGGRIRMAKGGTASTSAKEAGPTGVAAVAAGLERKIVNCLGCGKIYDCRTTTSSDVTQFLARGGTCTFCRRKVALTYVGAQQQQLALQQSDTATAAPDEGSAAPPAKSATDQDAAAQAAQKAADEAAQAFKDRLVLYDRESAKRTTVIDDQSDYFEVDTNAWLTDAERVQMREQRRLEAEAEAVRRNRVAITLDLVGRRVLVADPGAADVSAGASFRTGDDPTVSAYDPKVAATTGGMWTAPTSTAAPPPGTGSGPPPPLEARLQEAARGLRSMRAVANPDAKTPAPRFVPATATGKVGKRDGPGAAAGGSGAAQGAGGSAAACGQGGGGRVSRLQTDITEVFDAFGAEVLHENLEAGGGLGSGR